jgi:hypothetical protein
MLESPIERSSLGPNKKTGETHVREVQEILAIAVAALALTTASMAASGDALAKGSGGGGGGGGGGKGNGHGWSHFGGGVVVIDSGCWRWLPGYGRVYVCN